MLLAIDIGNTNTVLGVFDGEQVVDHWRMATVPDRTADELAVMLHGLLSRSSAFEEKDIDGIALCSTVPSALHEMRETCQRYYGSVPTVIVEPGVKTGVPVRTDNPKEAGSDRIMNSLAAVHLYGGPAIVVDFGTSTNFDAVSARGEFVGGVLAPGIEISVDALSRRAAQLLKVEVAKPPRVIGKNTVESLQSGIIYGFAGQVEGIVRRMAAELSPSDPDAVNVIATGGLAPLVVDEVSVIDAYEPWLTLIGLRLVFEKNTELLDAYRTHENRPVDRVDADRNPVSRCVDHVPVADIDPDVADVAEVEQQVAGLQVSPGYMHARVEQVAGVMRQRNAELRESPDHQAGAVENRRASGTPHVRVALLGERVLQRLLADRGRGRHADLRVMTGLRVNRHRLRHGGAVHLVDARVDGLLLGVHLSPDALHVCYLLLSGFRGPPGLVFRLGEDVDLVAVRLVEFGDRRGLLEELLRVAGAEHLHCRVQAGTHVILGGELGDRQLAGLQRCLIPRCRLLGYLLVGLSPAQLDPQPVILLAEGVDLQFQLLGLGHQLGQRRLRRGRLGQARRARHCQGQQGSNRCKAGDSGQFAHSVGPYWNLGDDANQVGELLPYVLLA